MYNRRKVMTMYKNENNNKRKVLLYFLLANSKYDVTE